MADNPKDSQQILVAEDDPSISRLLDLTFANKSGWDVTVVPCGAHAVEAWERGNYDLILMDLKLPRMDGLEAAKCIRRLEIELERRRTPIIAFSAQATEERRRQCLEAGLDEFISKPVKMAAVIEKMKCFLPDLTK